MKAKHIATMLILLAILGYASATTYYLDINGVGEDGISGTSDDVVSSDNNPGTSPGMPWKTLAKAQAAVTSGDTVIIRNGSYGAYSESGVNRTDWVTYRAAPGHTPVLSKIWINNYPTARNSYLKFDGFKVENGNQGVEIFIQCAKYLYFLNLDIKGGVDDFLIYGDPENLPAIKLNGNWGPIENVVIDNCTIQSSQEGIRSGYTTGIYIRGGESNNVTVMNCDISDTYLGIAVGGQNIIVKNNNIHKLASDGIVIGGDNITIENNQIHGLYLIKPNLAETPTDTTWNMAGTVMTNPSAKWNTSGDNFVVAGHMEIHVLSGTNAYLGDGEATGNSFVVSSVSQDGTQITLSRGIANGGQPSDVNYYIKSSTHTDLIQVSAYSLQSNVIIRGNQFYDTGGQLAHINPELNTEPNSCGGRDFLIENNLFWSSYANSSEGSEHWLNINHTKNLIFRNNIVIGALRIWQDDDMQLSGNIISRLSSEGTVKYTKENYNIINRGSFTLPNVVGPNDIILNPGQSPTKWNDPNFTGIFADYANRDFRHASASGLGVGHGDPANYPSTDILGNPRDANPDAGAYEFQGTIPQQPCTEAQLLDYISQWKQGNITMAVLMQKIGAWKAGTGCP